MVVMSILTIGIIAFYVRKKPTEPVEEARIRELEARLAVSEMPEEVSALIEDLQLVPDTSEDDKVSLDMIDEFLKDMGSALLGNLSAVQ